MILRQSKQKKAKDRKIKTLSTNNHNFVLKK
jgi:hypothetical protein